MLERTAIAHVKVRLYTNRSEYSVVFMARTPSVDESVELAKVGEA